MNVENIAIDIVASVTYPKDLGHWAMNEDQIEELKRSLRKLKAELKVFDIGKDEFPTLHGKNLVELELKSSDKDAKSVLSVLKKVKAFPIEQHHIVNLKKREEEIEEE